MSENNRTLHYSTSGLRPKVIAIAPEADEPKSKRHDIIQNEDENLVRNLSVLEEGTKARNREIQRRLDAVWDSTSGWEAKLRTEATEAVESVSIMKEEYQAYIRKFEKSFLSEINEIFTKYDTQLIPGQEEKLKREEDSLDVFFKKTVPEHVEKQSGEVSRQLKKQYETFDIEKQKGQKKEKKFIGKCSSHIQTTAQSFHDEDALLASCFFNLGEEIIDNERRSARMHLRRYDLAVKSVVDVRDQIREEERIREVEDVDLLDTVIDTQKLLQQTILEHFGSDEQAKDFGKSADFKKLEKRMSRVSDNNSARAGSKASRPGSKSESKASSRPPSNQKRK